MQISDETRQAILGALNTLAQRVDMGLTAPQILAVLTEEGVQFFENDPNDESELFSALSRTGMRKAVATVCMWADRTIGIPSMALRRFLLSLCPENDQALLILQGETQLIARPLAACIS